MARVRPDDAIGGDMPAPYSQDLRERVIGFMALGGGARAAATRFDVSVSSALRWGQRWWAEGHARSRAACGITVALSTVHRYLAAQNLTLKKRAYTRPSRTARMSPGLGACSSAV